MIMAMTEISTTSRETTMKMLEIRVMMASVEWVGMEAMTMPKFRPVTKSVMGVETT